MASHTTFRIGGRVRYLLYPESADALIAAVTYCREKGIPCALVGNGSNLLWQDADFDSCVLFTSGMKRVTVDGTCVRADAGAHLSAVCIAARDAGLGGLAFAYGIPGSVGGAVYMNAGAYDGEVGQRITAVTYYDSFEDRVVTVPGEDCAFGYRTSVFSQKKAVILSAEFSLEKDDPAVIRAAMEDYLARRREKQPLEFPSAGSAFKRYPGYFTAKLIDEAGLKGYSVGGAQVSDKHAGFIVNRGGATAADVNTLIAYVKEKIFAQNGIWIEPEIRTVGDCLL